MSARRVDPWLAGSMGAALVLRLVPVLVWGIGVPIRDEAIYLQLAQRISRGLGMTAPKDWLWAPGYPYLLAGARFLPGGAVRVVPLGQVLLAVATCAVMYALALRATGDRRTARWSAWLFALHPTLIYFAGRIWCEAVYGPVLLMAVLGLLWARDGSWRRGAVPGVLLGLCVLMRGVATWLPPIFAVAALWPEEGEGWRTALRARWRHALAVVLVTAATVAPYSVHATLRYKTPVVNDATLGNLMYLGNNDFQPITFDYGNGLLRNAARKPTERLGRPSCDVDHPVVWNRCEVAAGRKWIAEHPSEFLRRVPLRVAQFLNPHSFATRSLRWGRFRGVPWWGKEGLILWIAGWSFAVMGLGTVGAAARARGPYGLLAGTIVFYTLAASAATYGLTRFRVPLEPLWLVFLAGVLARPRETLALLRADRRRALGAVVLGGLAVVHLLWFLPTGWPGWNW